MSASFSPEAWTQRKEMGGVNNPTLRACYLQQAGQRAALQASVSVPVWPVLSFDFSPLSSVGGFTLYCEKREGTVH